MRRRLGGASRRRWRQTGRTAGPSSRTLRPASEFADLPAYGPSALAGVWNLLRAGLRPARIGECASTGARRTSIPAVVHLAATLDHDRVMRARPSPSLRERVSVNKIIVPHRRHDHGHTRLSSLGLKRTSPSLRHGPPRAVQGRRRRCAHRLSPACVCQCVHGLRPSAARQRSRDAACR